MKLRVFRLILVLSLFAAAYGVGRFTGTRRNGSGPVVGVTNWVAASASTGSTTNPSAPFHWSQLESTNYRVFVRNLRRIGCPESTLGDIVMADLLAAGRLDSEARNALWSQLASALPDRARARVAVGVANKLMRDFHLTLSEPSSVPAVRPVLAGGGGDRSNASPATDPKPASDFTPGNFSNEPAALRAMLQYRGLRLTPHEASALGRLEPGWTGGLEELGADTPSERSRAVRELLGEDRYSEYERRQDPSYSRLQGFLEDLGKEPDEIVQVYESLKESGKEAEPEAVASELEARFGADAAERWRDLDEQSRRSWAMEEGGASSTQRTP